MKTLLSFVQTPFGVVVFGVLAGLVTSAVLHALGCEPLYHWLPLSTGVLSVIVVTVSRAIPRRS